MDGPAQPIDPLAIDKRRLSARLLRSFLGRRQHVSRCCRDALASHCGRAPPEMSPRLFPRQPLPVPPLARSVIRRSVSSGCATSYAGILQCIPNNAPPSFHKDACALWAIVQGFRCEHHLSGVLEDPTLYTSMDV